MANYKETTLAGTSYIRANRVEVSNSEVEKFISFSEEKVINLDDGEVLRQYAGSVVSEFTPENADTRFTVLNPETGAPIRDYDSDAGAEVDKTASFQEVYTMLYSLYLHLALERDNAPAEEPPVEEPVIEPLDEPTGE